jgi:hypothetical protein
MSIAAPEPRWCRARQRSVRNTPTPSGRAARLSRTLVMITRLRRGSESRRRAAFGGGDVLSARDTYLSDGEASGIGGASAAELSLGHRLLVRRQRSVVGQDYLATGSARSSALVPLGLAALLRLPPMRSMLEDGSARQGDRSRRSAVLDGAGGVACDHGRRASPVQVIYQRKRVLEGGCAASWASLEGGLCKRAASALVAAPPTPVGFQLRSRHKAYGNEYPKLRTQVHVHGSGVWGSRS